jgi:simple sugar transport system substrate-binding protein
MNTTRTRRLVAGAVTALAALSLAACSGGSSGTDDTKASGGGSGTINVGFSQLGAESGWRTANTDSVKAAFTKDKGFDLTFVDAQQKQENQIKAIRDFIDQGVDAIAFSPVVETGWDQVLQEAKDAEIPVVLVDRTVKTTVSDPYATYIGNDFTKEGETAVAWIKKNAADAKIFELQGTLGSSAQVDREKPVDAELGSQIIGKASGNFTRAEGKAATEAALQAYPAMTMIVSHNDDMALGAIEAIEAAGKKPGTDIKIVSFDGVRDGLQALHDKKFNYVVECNPVYGDQIADLVKKVVGGEDVPTRTIVPDQAFDQTITQETIDARKY